MNNALPTLQKLTQRQLEQLQLKIAALNDRIAANQAEQAKHQAARLDGFTTAIRANTDAILYDQAGDYASRVAELIPELQEIEQELLVEYEALQDQLRALFAERERYNILIERKRIETLKSNAKANQAQLDELAIQKRS